MILFAALVATGRAVAAESATPVAEVVFGGGSAYPPFEWRGESGPRGFNVAFARAMAAGAGVRARVELRPWNETMAALRSGAVDVVPMFRSDARAADFRFSDPFLYVDVHAYGMPQLPKANEPADLEGRRVAVVAGSYSRRITEAAPDVELRRVPTAAAGLGAVQSGKADYALLPRATVEALRQRRAVAPGIRHGGPPLWSVAYVFAVRKDSQPLVRWVDEQLDTLVETGRYRTIRDDWHSALEPGRTSLAEALRIGALVIVPIVVLAAAAGLWSGLLRRKVRARTRHLDAELARRQAAEREARHLATHEQSTGLAWRPHFEEALGDRLATSGALDLVVLKLAQLGEVTCRFGHAAGAAAVEGFAERLGALDAALVGYFGGRTFAAVVAAGEAEAVVECLSPPLALNDPDIEIDPVVRAGIARFPADGDRAHELLRRAETALAATGHRRTAVRRYTADLEADPDDLALVRDFRRDEGQAIELVLQPQIELASGRVAGAEALVRWRHPQLGDVSPARFVPLLERAGLVGMLTLQMIDCASAASAALRARSLPARISVNISAHDLLQGDLASEIRARLARHGARAEDLSFELTETSLAADSGSVGAQLAAIKALGASVSIDDFGTGYASLAYLTAFPLDEVKIDREFVGDLLAERRHAAVVYSTLRMAHEMELACVAEGIEDEATRAALVAAGCRIGQGYHFAAAMALERYIEYLDGGAGADDAGG